MPGDTGGGISPRVNGVAHPVTVDNRTTLLDAVREGIGLTGPRKGCDRGQCGAARRQAGDGDLTAVQEAFVRLDGLQCGYCTPGQLCSAVGMLAEHVENCAELTKTLYAAIAIRTRLTAVPVDTLPPFSMRGPGATPGSAGPTATTGRGPGAKAVRWSGP